jgi:hypothetical protein
MKILSFFKKLWPSKKKKGNKPIAALRFEVDKEGTVWIDCAWDEKSGSHILFADLAYRVMYSQLVEETLTFLKDECTKEGMEAHFWEIFEHLTKLEKISDIQSSLFTLPEPESDEIVVKPTDIAKKMRGDE